MPFVTFGTSLPSKCKLPTIAQPVGILISIPLTAWLIKVIEKRTLMLIAIGAFVITYSIPAPVEDPGGTAGSRDLSLWRA